MTIERVRALTDDALRVGIARALGIKYVGSSRTDPSSYCGAWVWEWPDGTCRPLPDWPRSLDACAELRLEVWRKASAPKYIGWLCRLTEYKKALTEDAALWFLVHATARQHAEAALLALGGKDVTD